MRFGTYIREIRHHKAWTQPEAARQIGIEQSYLSKLEAGKSYPSEDVFSSLMAVYAIDLPSLTQKLFAGELDQLRDIAEVRAAILDRENAASRRTQILLTAGIAALFLGGACLGLAVLAKDTSRTRYLYQADAAPTGEIAPGGTTGIDTGPDADTHTDIGADLRPATRTHYKALDDYRNVVVFETTPDGPRTWRFYGTREDIVKSPLRWFSVPALSLILGAVGFFYASTRVSAQPSAQPSTKGQRTR